ncbi:Cell-death-related nuclease 7 [Tetrabaena socialis]|uniref:Cell-death-related nuclease 7 n=1 Tax=Tetrabaena socialis TaxID=47790 RepID=A0A2J8A8Q0_9CHLO|nr:Cell-death-related nuclease 7 [Tetrabaena socialis]|eukprot:PNH08914.1 Cell-death-related nuclease 7 [Tetrabaena socialis]
MLLLLTLAFVALPGSSAAPRARGDGPAERSLGDPRRPSTLVTSGSPVRSADATERAGAASGAERAAAGAFAGFAAASVGNERSATKGWSDEGDGSSTGDRGGGDSGGSGGGSGSDGGSGDGSSGGSDGGGGSGGSGGRGGSGGSSNGGGSGGGGSGGGSGAGGGSFGGSSQGHSEREPEPAGPQCLSQGGLPVDWWVLLKFPGGEDAALLDSRDLTPSARPQPQPQQQQQQQQRQQQQPEEEPLKPCWRGGASVNDRNGPLRATLAAALAPPQPQPAMQPNGTWRPAPEAMHQRADLPYATPPASPYGYVFYNDADPEGVEHWGFAHAKGALLLGPEGGVWLTHSFPRYPGRPPRTGGDADLYGGAGVRNGSASEWDVVQHPQMMYGQHALCLSLPRRQLLRVAESLLVAAAYVYEYDMPYDLAELYGTVQELVDASAEERGRGAAAGGGGGGRGGGDGSRDGGDVAGGGGGGRDSSDGDGSVSGGGIPRRGLRDAPASAAPVAPHAPPPAPPRNTSVRSLRTWGGSAWLHVAKSPNHTVPFHEQVLEPLLHAAMAWETWRLGISYPSECPPETPYGSLNIRRVVVPYCAAGDERVPSRVYGNVVADGAIRSSSRDARAAPAGGDAAGAVGRGAAYGGGGAGWDSLKDHSKWGLGISTAAQTPGPGAAAGGGAEALASLASAATVCLGDLNRQPSQRFRGGGYVCTQDAGLWAAFNSLVAELEPCAAAGPSDAASGASGAEGPF